MSMKGSDDYEKKAEEGEREAGEGKKGWQEIDW